MSTASFETPSGDDRLIMPQRIPRRSAATALSGGVDSTVSRGPRLVLRVPELNAPALSAAPTETAKSTAEVVTVAATTVAGAQERVTLRERLHQVAASLRVREHLFMAIRAVVLRNLLLLTQPQLWLQPKLLLAGVGAIVMTMAGLIVSGERAAHESDDLGAAPAWQPPSIAAPDWTTVAQPTATATNSAAAPQALETEAPPFVPPVAKTCDTSTTNEAPTWQSGADYPSAPNAIAAPNQPMTAKPANTANSRYPAAGQAAANGPAAVERYPETIARRPESPSAYPATPAREAPPQARITGKITVLPGEPTP